MAIALVPAGPRRPSATPTGSADALSRPTSTLTLFVVGYTIIEVDLTVGMMETTFTKGALGGTAASAILGVFLRSPLRPRVMDRIAVARGPEGTVPTRA